MGLGPTAQPSLVHRWNSNREILNPTNQKVGGGGKVGHFPDLREGRGPGNKRGGVLSPSFWKTGCMPQYYQIS